MFGKGEGEGISSASSQADLSNMLPRIAVGLLTLMSLVCVHAILYHLHAILAPFMLSGIVVFALEPSVQRIYSRLAGLLPPYRWCGCCARRRWKSRRSVDENAPREHTPSESSDAESPETEERREAGESQILLADHVERDWEGYTIQIADMTCRIIAVIIVLVWVAFIVWVLVYMLSMGALQIRYNWPAYQRGVRNWEVWLDNVTRELASRLKLSGAMEKRAESLYSNMLSKVQELLLEMVDVLISFVSGNVTFTVMVLLYMVFWLFQPLPMSGKASSLVQSYMWKKTIVGVVYGSSVAIFLWCLGIDLPIFFGLISFILYFVPEVGALISIVAPVPLVLFNGNIESPSTMLVMVLTGQIVLKLLVGNYLEVRLIQDDEEMSLHPVWVLLSLNYFGFLWGPVGMLVSVPLLALIKSVATYNEDDLRERQPYLADIASQVSACLEGRKHKSERRRSQPLLPFAAKDGMDSGPMPGTDPQEDDTNPTDKAASKEASEDPAPTGPKKPRPSTSSGQSQRASVSSA